MKNSFLTLATLTALSSFQFAHAQREAPDRAVKREQRQQQTAQMTPTERAQFQQQRFQERLKSATPEQREQMMARRAQMETRMRQQGLDPNNPADVQKARGARGGRGGNRGQNANPAARDASRRALMNASGISETPVQDAIIAFMDEEAKARQPVLLLARAVATSLDPNAVNNSDELVATRLETYQRALALDKTRHQNALAELDAKISYSTKPRLKAFLNLIGVLDSDSLAIGGAAAIFPRAAQGDAPQSAARAARRANRGNRNAGEATGATVGAEIPTQAAAQ